MCKEMSSSLVSLSVLESSEEGELGSSEKLEDDELSGVETELSCELLLNVDSLSDDK